MNRPLVSIVIPAYNPPEDSFCACMDSVLAQSYNELEIILVDDGSTMACADLMDTWAQRDVRVQVVHQKNSGVGNARNRGIELAHGKYISFVDADDCVIDSWISRAVVEAEKENVDIIYGSVYLIKSMQEKYDSKEKMEIYSQTYEREDLWNVQQLLLSNKKNPLPGLPYLDYGPCGKLFRTELVKQILFPTDLSLMEDQVFNHAVLRKSQKVVVTDIPAYYYIINMGSATQKNRPDAINIMLYALDQIRTYLFDKTEVNNAYYYRVINEMIIGIQMSYFYPGGRQYTFWEKYKAVKKTFLNKKVDNAVQKFRFSTDVERKRIKIKIQLLKHHIYLPFMIRWSLKNRSNNRKLDKNAYE